MSSTNLNNLSQYDLAYALPGAFASLASGGAWKYARHLKYIEDRLIQCHNKRLRLLISVPPQQGKTNLCSIAFPCWYLGHYPDKKVMLLTYQQTYSEDRSRDARNMFREHGPSVFGIGVSQQSRRVDSWRTDKGGLMYAIGVGGAITGKGANCLIVDDFVKGREEALNPNILDDKWDTFWSDVYSRLSPNAHIIVIGTRWSDEDIIGRLKKRMDQGDEYTEQFEVINLPAIAEDEDDPLGRQIGEPLVDDTDWPYYRSYEDWMMIKANTPSHWWDALYMGRPAPRTGNLINLDWFRYYDTLPKDPDKIIVSWDTAQKATELSDFTVAGIHLEKDGKYYLADVQRDRMEHPRLLKLFNEIEDTWHPHAHVIEDKGSGSSLIQHALSESRGNVIPMEPDRSKEIRADAESVAIQSGRYLLPDPEKNSVPWLSDFLDEVRLFPRGHFDDQVDMMSQALKFFREGRDREPLDMF